MKDIPLFWLFVGFLFIGISAPLILKKVPPNQWYRFRISKTFSSDRIWYAANQVAGYDLLWAGVAISVTAITTGLFFDQLGSTFIQIVNLAIFLSTLIGAFFHSFRSVNQL